MVNAALPSFLTLPDRAEKPRSRGITHVLDKGMPVDDVSRVLQVAGRYIDVWKLGWGTAYLDPGLEAKLALLAEHAVMACTGGTLLEVAWQQGVADAYFDWACSQGFPSVEVSCGVAEMGLGEKQRLISMAAQRFVTLAEVGTKDPAAAVTAEAWAAEARADLEAGARWVVTEGRESGTVGLYDPNGRVRAGVVSAVVEAAGLDRIIFEAPRKDQQAWLIRHLGPDVGLGNIAAPEVLGMEALRLGLRADTFDATRSPGGRPS
jgi:phosphosulfolactate synthase